MDPMLFVQSAIPFITLFVLKVIGALIIWVIGRKLIHVAARLVVRSLRYPLIRPSPPTSAPRSACC